MPPAFNLSQDQTLQFDLSRFHHSLDSTPPRPLDEERNANTVGNRPVTTRTSVVRVLSTSGKPPKLARHKRRRPEAPASAPTPTDCQLLKSNSATWGRLRMFQATTALAMRLPEGRLCAAEESHYRTGTDQTQAKTHAEITSSATSRRAGDVTNTRNIRAFTRRSRAGAAAARPHLRWRPASDTSTCCAPRANRAGSRESPSRAVARSARPPAGRRDPRTVAPPARAGARCSGPCLRA